MPHSPAGLQVVLLVVAPLYCGDVGGFAGDVHCCRGGVISRAASSSSSRFVSLPICNPASRFPLGLPSSQFQPARQLNLSIVAVPHRRRLLGLEAGIT
ncbi:hypothetical protein C8R45DRAFT_1031889, partial [Mycena sanguinolenta]